jgi:phage terminase large subunit-like protein
MSHLPSDRPVSVVVDRETLCASGGSVGVGHEQSDHARHCAGQAPRACAGTGDGDDPAHLIAHTTTARGLPGALEGARIKHVSGGESILGFKSYEQGRPSFEGTAKHVIWDDEEPPMDVYTEQLLRTMTTKGVVLVTFTPLQGMSEVVTGFLEPSEAARVFKWFIQAGWKDVPHLDETEKAAIKASTPLYQIQARMDGEPVLGAGAIYPIAEAELIVPTRPIPETWRRVYGMDIGWNRTAAVWAAEDPGSGGSNCIPSTTRARGAGQPCGGDSGARGVDAGRD